MQIKKSNTFNSNYILYNFATMYPKNTKKPKNHHPQPHQKTPKNKNTHANNTSYNNNTNNT